jgi:hypothetical protein
MRASIVVVLALSSSAGCGAPDAPGVAAAALRPACDNPNPGVLFDRHAHPFGASMETWSERSWQWVYGIPAAQNPFLDLTGADCAVDQQGPVWYLASVSDPGGVASFTRRCAIPRHRALFVNLSGVLNDFPCPDPTFVPAPGQSLFAFLSTGAKQIVDAVTEIDVTLDGKALKDILGYRIASDDLFQITGDVSLQTTLDGCITGKRQPAVSDGYFIMFEPLAPGAHTLVVRAVDNHGTDVTLTYLLTIG